MNPLFLIWASLKPVSSFWLILNHWLIEKAIGQRFYFIFVLIIPNRCILCPLAWCPLTFCLVSFDLLPARFESLWYVQALVTICSPEGASYIVNLIKNKGKKTDHRLIRLDKGCHGYEWSKSNIMLIVVVTTDLRSALMVWKSGDTNIKHYSYKFAFMVRNMVYNI